MLCNLHDETHASAASHIVLYIATLPTDGGLPLPPAAPPLIGSFHDRLEKTDGGCRFTERRGTLDFRMTT